MAAPNNLVFKATLESFNTQPPEGGCGYVAFGGKNQKVSTHSHPKVAAKHAAVAELGFAVSTHSHPKVAACAAGRAMYLLYRFNTQPPEGGCLIAMLDQAGLSGVSTHSHPKVAADRHARCRKSYRVSTHSHPKVAAIQKVDAVVRFFVSTHSHPKVAAAFAVFVPRILTVSTHSHPKVAASFTGI